jgi:hypothetical protein
MPVTSNDGNVSFTVPPGNASAGVGSLKLPLRRRRSTAANNDESSSSSQREGLRTPASFVVAGDAVSVVEAARLSAAREVSFDDAATSNSPPRRPGPRIAIRSRTPVERKSATIKLGLFTGSNVPLATHLAKLDNCATYYGWHEEERVCHLKASLDGNAASLLWALLASCSEMELLQLLHTRFGDRDQIERYRFELRTRRRRKGESLQSL